MTHSQLAVATVVLPQVHQQQQASDLGSVAEVVLATLELKRHHQQLTVAGTGNAAAAAALLAWASPINISLSPGL